MKRASGKTKTAAKDKLKEVLRDYEDGLAIAPTGCTVKDAVTDWLAYGLNGRDVMTVTTNTILCNTHVIPALGARKLRDLSADDMDKWLAEKSKVLSTRSLEAIRSCLNRAVKRAMARDKVQRNVVELRSAPAGRPGRPSKSLTLAQAEGVLVAAEDSPLYAYIVVSMLTGGRTEEIRPLRWDHVDLEGDPDAHPEIPPHIAVWRSVRSTGDTKTRKSRRTLALPGRAIDALMIQWERQGWQRLAAGDKWQESGLVFFVSILSDRGIPLEEISRLVGDSSTAVTEEVYRKQIRPVIQTGATAMDGIFGAVPKR